MAGTSDSGGFEWDENLTHCFNHDETSERLECSVLLETSNGPSGSQRPTLTLQPASASRPLNPPIFEEARRDKRKMQQTDGKSAPPKRIRAPNWSDGEKHALLVLKLETLVRPDVTESWIKTVSNHRDINDRCTTSCQGQWDTLKKQYDVIRVHESKILSGASSCTSFWKMNEHEKIEVNEKLPQNEKLPRVFYKAWYVLMENITEAEAVKRTLPRKLIKTIQVLDGNLPPSSSHIPSTNKDLANFLSSQGNLQPESYEKLGISDDHLISRLAPYVNKQIEEALKPLNSVLRIREEEEQKHREKLLAIEEELLAMKREEMQLRRHVFANPMETASPFGTQAGVDLSVQTTSAWGHSANILPAITEDYPDFLQDEPSLLC